MIDRNDDVCVKTLMLQVSVVFAVVVFLIYCTIQ